MPVNQAYKEHIWEPSGAFFSTLRLGEERSARNEFLRLRTDLMNEPKSQSHPDTIDIPLLGLSWGGLLPAIDWQAGPASPRLMSFSVLIDPVYTIPDFNVTRL